MTDRSLTPVTVAAVRIGRTNLGEGRIVLDDDAISVLVRSTSDDRPVRLGFESVDSVAVAGNELVLGLRDGSRVTFISAGAAQFGAAIMTKCRALPELTRTLRTFGSRRGTRSRRDSAAADQKRFFGPLLEARRAAGSSSAPAATVAAFDASTLAEALTAALRQFAAERHAEEGPARRALEAELDEIAEPLLAALSALAEAGAGARNALDDLKSWRSWAGQLRTTFEVADRVWMSLDVALDSAPLHP
jgi:hypothetical protein